jgi:hypothetical protein
MLRRAHPAGGEGLRRDSRRGSLPGCARAPDCPAGRGGQDDNPAGPAGLAVADCAGQD